VTLLVEMERRLQAAVASIPLPARHSLLFILTLDARERAEALRRLHARATTRPLAELLMDLEEDRTAAALVVGELLRLTRAQAQPPTHSGPSDVSVGILNVWRRILQGPS
jgi:hypothetical protein